MRGGGEVGGRIEVAILLEQRVDLGESLVVSHKAPLYRFGARGCKRARARPPR